jgi:hypothetical protein
MESGGKGFPNRGKSGKFPREIRSARLKKIEGNQNKDYGGQFDAEGEGDLTTETVITMPCFLVILQAYSNAA